MALKNRNYWLIILIFLCCIEEHIIYEQNVILIQLSMNTIRAAHQIQRTDCGAKFQESVITYITKTPFSLLFFFYCFWLLLSFVNRVYFLINLSSHLLCVSLFFAKSCRLYSFVSCSLVLVSFPSDPCLFIIVRLWIGLRLPVLQPGISVF